MILKVIFKILNRKFNNKEALMNKKIFNCLKIKINKINSQIDYNQLSINNSKNFIKFSKIKLKKLGINK